MRKLWEKRRYAKAWNKERLELLLKVSKDKKFWACK
jgi:hypothetical protein